MNKIIENIKGNHGKVRDVQIRVQDIQDRIYDVLAQQESKILRQQEVINDLSIRIKDIQDSMYNLLWQQKTMDYQRSLMFWQIYKRRDETIQEAQRRFFKALPPADGIARKSQLVLTALLGRIHDVCYANGIRYWLDFGTLLGAVRHSGFIPWDDDIDIGMMRTDLEKFIILLKNDKDLTVNYLLVNSKINGIAHRCQVRWADVDGHTYNANIDIFIYDFCKQSSDVLWKYFKKEKKELVNESKKFPPFPNSDGIEPYRDTFTNLYNSYFEKVKKKLQITMEDGDNIIWGFDNFYYTIYHDRHLFGYETIFPLRKLSFEGKEFMVPNRYFEYVNTIYEDIFSLPSDILSHTHFTFTPKTLEALDAVYKKYVKNE